MLERGPINKQDRPDFDALSVWSSIPGVLNFYGSFQQGAFQNSIFEFADKGTLAEFFEQTIPPVKFEEIRSFWQNLFQLANCLAWLEVLPLELDWKDHFSIIPQK